jgi:opacity protein-like surface antigen
MLKRFAFALALLLAFSAPVSAEVNGVYAGIKFIDSIQSTGPVSHDLGILSDVGIGLGIGEYSQNTVGGGVFVGYDFYPQHNVPIRTEIEYAIRTNMNTSWDANYGIQGVRSLESNIDAQWNLQTLMLNAYWDFHNSTNFTPYVGAGLGMGFINSRYEVTGSVPAIGVENFHDTYNSTDTVFAWNTGLGCSYAFSENVSADLAYRFVGLGYHETSENVYETDIKAGMSPYANEVSLGLRFTF